MAQPQMARIACSQCNAWYGSDRELRDHMQTAHRKSVSENSLPPSSAPADSAKQGCATSFLMEKRGETGEVCGDVRPDPKEEYVQPEKEKEAGGEG